MHSASVSAKHPQQTPLPQPRLHPSPHCVSLCAAQLTADQSRLYKSPTPRGMSAIAAGYSNEGCEALGFRPMWIGVADFAARHQVKFYWPAASFLRSSCGVFSVDQVSSCSGEGGVSQSPRWIFTFAMKFAEMGAVTNRNPMISNS